MEGTSIATHFPVMTGRPKELAIAAAEAAGVAITATPGLSVPPLAEVEFDGAAAITGICGMDDFSLHYAIGGGTNEIQRTLIAVRGLGLPR